MILMVLTCLFKFTLDCEVNVNANFRSVVIKINLLLHITYINDAC